MENRLKLYERALELHERGLSGQRVARELGVCKGTIDHWIYQGAKHRVCSYFEVPCAYCGKVLRRPKGRMRKVKHRHFCSLEHRIEWQRKNAWTPEKRREWHRQWYWKNHEKAREIWRRYASKHRDILRAHNRKIRQERQDRWGRIHRLDFESIRESEIFVTEEVLPKLGFTDIVLTRSLWGPTFPIDIVAKKNGEQCAIDVSLSYHRKIRPNVRAFCRRFNLRLFFCYVKPDYSFYFLKEVDLDRSYDSIWGMVKERFGVDQGA